MFATEINWREKVGLYDVNNKKYVMFNYINGLIPVDADTGSRNRRTS